MIPSTEKYLCQKNLSFTKTTDNALLFSLLPTHTHTDKLARARTCTESSRFNALYTRNTIQPLSSPSTREVLSTGITLLSLITRSQATIKKKKNPKKKACSLDRNYKFLTPRAGETMAVPKKNYTSVDCRMHGPTTSPYRRFSCEAFPSHEFCTAFRVLSSYSNPHSTSPIPPTNKTILFSSQVGGEVSVCSATPRHLTGSLRCYLQLGQLC